MGQGPEEYISMTSIILDEENDEMFVHCSSLKNIFTYDLFGNFKQNFKYMVGGDKSSRLSASINYDPIYNFDRDNLICFDFTSGRNFSSATEVDVEPRNIFWIISKLDGSITKEIQIPFEKKILQVLFLLETGRIGVVYNKGLIPYRDGWILTETSADTIYNYSANHEMTPFIVRTPSVQSMNPEVFLFPGVLTDRYYFLQTIKKEYESNTAFRGNLRKIDLVYDKQEDTTFECVVYNGDFASKRPVANMVEGVPIFTVVNSNDVAFIENIEAFELVEAYEKGELKGRLKEIAANMDEEDNPVIMVAKYKK